MWSSAVHGGSKLKNGIGLSLQANVLSQHNAAGIEHNVGSKITSIIS